MTCPRCRADNRAAARFCRECGATLGVVCSSCGAEVEPGSRFCDGCGAALAAGPAGVPGAPRFASPESYTPRHLAERILTAKASLEGERKQVTVLFADLKGSTELLADRDPEEARTILDPVLELMMAAVHRYEGTVNQVMGDGIMALFGAPVAHEDHAVRAGYAALRMQEAIRRYAEEARRSHGIEVRIRVGLNSGAVVVRTIASDLRMDYSAVGPTTHLAARMEQLAPPGAIWLTAETLRRAEGFVEARPLGPVPVKGVPEPVEVFELVGAAGARSRLEAARARGLTRFVGRDAEVEYLGHAAEPARRGRGQVVAVVGEPGVGKSRLVHEFVRSPRADGWRVLEASAVSHGQTTPFLLLADLLRRYGRVDDRDDAPTVRAKVTGALLALDPALTDALPAALWILDALGRDEAFLALEPAQRRQRAIEGARRVLLRESQRQPLLLVLEDLHLIDAETQGFLDGLVESLPAAAVLLVVSYRPEYRHDWGGKTYYRQLRVDPLPPAGAEALLRTLLGEDPSVQPLMPLLIERTDGNPFFLEESVRTLVETRALLGDPGRRRLGRSVTAIDIPASVKAILAARIDRLGLPVKRLLQAASVVGKDVPLAVLEAVADLRASELPAALAELQAAEFLYPTQLFPDLEYTFKHALTHETAYDSLLQDRRRALHAAIVSALERLHAGRLTEHLERLAHHAARGGITDKAARYLRLAGEKSVARSAIREATEFLEGALRALEELPETADTLSDGLDVRIALGPALISLRGASAPRVAEVYREALALVDRLDAAARRFPVVWGLWFIGYTLGRYAEARAIGERLLVDAEGGEDTGRLVEAHHALWPTLLAMGETAAAVPHMERGIALYQRERDAAQAFLYAGHDPGACCRYHLGLARWLLGYPDAAMAVLGDGQRLAEELDHAQTMTITLWVTVVVQLLRGDRAAAAATAERLAAITGAHGFVHYTDIAIVAAGPAPVDGPDLAERHERLMRVPTAVWRRVACVSHLVTLCLEAGCVEEGRRALASLGPAGRDAFLGPEIRRLEGELVLADPRVGAGEAESHLRAAVADAQRRREKSLELRAASSLARCLDRQGRRAEARDALRPIHGWFTEGRDTADLRAATALLDALSAGAG